MSPDLRSPLLWVGLGLALLGGGNWIGGQSKLADYQLAVVRDQALSSAASFAGYPHLTRRTNADLLRPLRSTAATRTFPEAKRDFYQVVLTGGKLLTLLGLFLMLVSLLWERRKRRRDHLSWEAKQTPT